MSPSRFISVVFLLFVGCQMTAQPVVDNKTHDKPKSVATAEDIFAELANAVHEGTIGTTTDLARCVKLLGDNGKLSKQDLSNFDSAIRDAASTERNLNESDESALRGIK